MNPQYSPDRIQRHKLDPQAGQAADAIVAAAVNHFATDGLSADTVVPTADGWSEMGRLKPGQKLFDDAGNQFPVTAVQPRGRQEVYSVEMDDGTCLKTALHQPWPSLTRHLRRRLHRRLGSSQLGAPALIPSTTLDIAASLLHTSSNYATSMYTVPLARPLQLPHRLLPIDPYLLGLWLGDGTSTLSIITCHADDEPHYRQQARAAGENWRIGNNKDRVLSCFLTGPPDPRFRTRLKGLRVLGNKHIPPVYLRASEEQRLQLLWGLMDSDGAIDPGGHAEYTSKSEQLAAGVLEVALSLGQKATLRKGDAKLNGQVVSDKWRVHFRPTRQVASLPRKAERIGDLLNLKKGTNSLRPGRRYIRSVIPAGFAEVIALQFDSPYAVFLAGPQMMPAMGHGFCPLPHRNSCLLP